VYHIYIQCTIYIYIYGTLCVNLVASQSLPHSLSVLMSTQDSHTVYCILMSTLLYIYIYILVLVLVLVLFIF